MIAKMHKYHSKLIGISAGLLWLLPACSGNTPPPKESSNPNPSTTTPAIAAPTSSQTATNHNTTYSQGGQVIESGPYHLELVALPEAGGIHLDFFLQTGDNHEEIPDAKVTAQVQLPNGEQKTLDLPYDADGKHYAAFLPETAAGDYKIAILTDIKGEKVNGRFSFNR